MTGSPLLTHLPSFVDALSRSVAIGNPSLSYLLGLKVVVFSNWNSNPCVGLMVSERQEPCAFTAAQEGRLDVLTLMYEVCGKEMLMKVKEDGTSCAHIAAQEGHLDVLRWLDEACGKELLMMVDEEGRSCAGVAAANGHLDVLRWLNKVFGNELPVLAGEGATSCVCRIC